MAETLCAKADVQLKAGKNVSTNLTDANFTSLINQAESFINVEVDARDSSGNAEDLVSGFSGYAANVKNILQDACSSRAAVLAIQHEMNSYTDRNEAQTMINVNWAVYHECIRVLKEAVKSDRLQGI